MHILCVGWHFLVIRQLFFSQEQTHRLERLIRKVRPGKDPEAPGNGEADRVWWVHPVFCLGFFWGWTKITQLNEGMNKRVCVYIYIYVAPEHPLNTHLGRGEWITRWWFTFFKEIHPEVIQFDEHICLMAWNHQICISGTWWPSIYKWLFQLDSKSLHEKWLNQPSILLFETACLEFQVHIIVI